MLLIPVHVYGWFSLAVLVPSGVVLDLELDRVGWLSKKGVGLEYLLSRLLSGQSASSVQCWLLLGIALCSLEESHKISFEGVRECY